MFTGESSYMHDVQPRRRIIVAFLADILPDLRAGANKNTIFCFVFLKKCRRNSFSTNNVLRLAYPYGPLARYVELRVVHAPGMPGMPPRLLRTSRAAMHVEIANPPWQGKRSRHSQRMRNP